MDRLVFDEALWRPGLLFDTARHQGWSLLQVLLAGHAGIKTVPLPKVVCTIQSVQNLLRNVLLGGVICRQASKSAEMAFKPWAMVGP